MKESIFYNVHDVMNILNVGKTKAYKVMAELNAELTERGFMVVNGKDHWWGNVRHYVYDGLPYFFHEGQ